MQSKTALITGSSKNIGKGIARRLAAEGYNLVIHGRIDHEAVEELTQEIQESGKNAIGVLADLSQVADVDRLFQQTIQTFGKVDVLINNAAIRPHTDFLEMDDEEWHTVFNTNLHASFYLIKRSLPYMIENRWGRIINFAGLQAMRGYQKAAHVSASKHALWGLTKSLAKDYAGNGITSNIISPGPTYETSDADLVNVTPIGRSGTPEDIAAIVMLLLSDEGAYINGQMIQANGGLET